MHDLVDDLGDRFAVGAAVVEDLRRLAVEAVGLDDHEIAAIWHARSKLAFRARAFLIGPAASIRITHTPHHALATSPEPPLAIIPRGFHPPHARSRSRPW